MAKNTWYMKCPVCKEIVAVEKGYFGGFKKTTCMHCKMIFDPNDHRMTTGHCKKCNKSIQFNQFTDGAAVCPFCGDLLETELNRVEMRTVTCPHCNGKMQIDGSKAGNGVQCRHCQLMFDVEESTNGADMESISDIVINHRGMSQDQVLWRHPMNEFASNSKIVMDAGVGALVVSGQEFRALVRRSGMTLQEVLGNANRTEHVNVVFVRQMLTAPLPYGGAVKHLQDNRFSMKDTALVGFNGVIRLRIEDVQRFGQKVSFRECTEMDLGLINPQRVIQRDAEEKTGIPQINLSFVEYMTDACQATLNEDRRSILELSRYKGAVKERFVKQVQDALYRDWGLTVEDCTLNGLEANRGNLDVKLEDELIRRVSGEIRLGAISVHVHLKGHPELTAIISADGMAQIRVENLLRLKEHMDSHTWEASEDTALASRQIGEWITRNVSSILERKLQLCINESEMEDLHDLSLYERGIVDYAQETLANDNVYGYLYEHGLEMETLSLSLKVQSMSDALRRYEQLREKKTTTRIDVEEEKTTIATRDEIESVRDVAVHRRKEREYRSAMESKQLAHDEALIDMDQQAERQKHEDEYRMDATKREAAYQSYNDEYEQQREMRSQQHEQALTEIMIGVEQSKLGFREKLDAYARLKRMQDALSGAEASRVEATAEADIMRVIGESKLKLSQEEQRLMDEAAQSELERELAVRRQNMESDLEKLKLQNEVQRQARQAEEKHFDMKMEIERLNILVGCYEKQIQCEADTVRATAAAEVARREAQREYDRRYEEQQKREKAEREKAQRQDKEKEYEAHRKLEQMLDELKQIRTEIDRTNRGLGYTESDEMRRIAELERVIEKMYRELDSGAFFEADRRGKAGYGDWRDSRWENGRRQSGIGRDNVCPRCNAQNASGVSYCVRCGTRIAHG